MFQQFSTRFAITLTLMLGFSTSIPADEDLSRRPNSRTRPRVITQPKLDPAAAKLELFAGLKNGAYTTQVIPKNSDGGSLLITNTTDQPLTVAFPKSFVAVHVLKQFGAPPAGNLFNNQPPGGNVAGQQPGGQQAIGGGAQPPGNGNGNLFGPAGNGPGGNANGVGNGFFSIPPERTVRVAYVSACLEHGKPDPTPRAKYELVQTAEYTNDIVLQELIEVVAAGKANRNAVQAAVWHRTDDMSWQDLSRKFSYSVRGKVPYFKTQELQDAKRIAEAAVARADRHQTPTESEADVVTTTSLPR